MLERRLLLLGLLVASAVTAQGVGFSFGNRYRVDLLNDSACPVALLDGTYAKKPDYPVGHRDTDQNLLGYTVKQHIELKVQWENRSTKPITSADVSWSAFNVARKALGQPVARVAEYRPLKPGKSTFQVLNAPAIAGIEYFEVRVVAVQFADGTQWTRPEAASASDKSPQSAPDQLRGAEVPLQEEHSTDSIEDLAERGDAEAQCLVGRKFVQGSEVLQDFVKAHMWLNLAAAQGHKAARVERDELAKKMSAQQLEEAQRLAREWAPSTRHD